MKPDFHGAMEAHFDRLSQAVLSEARGTEFVTVGLSAEETEFIRFNGAKVRQTGRVDDATFHITYLLASKRISARLTLSGDAAGDARQALEVLSMLRHDAAALPDDPDAVAITGSERSHMVMRGSRPAADAMADVLLAPAQGTDFTGLFAGGAQVRAVATSGGLRHWFSTETFCVDYSLCHASGKAVKSVFAGRDFDAGSYTSALAADRARLGALDRPRVEIAPGGVRAYFAPAATADLVGMFSWNGISESALRQKESALRRMREEGVAFSPLFSLSEDFEEGWVPRFNEGGELAPERLPLVERGRLVNTLVSSRTAKEYGIASNGATEHEGLRSPHMAAGTLAEGDILARLGTGVYLSNLNYLNWSDVSQARVTGMTRHSCFWVEDGAIVGPIRDMRFDDTLFNVFGAHLEAVTEFRQTLPNTSTYGERALGADTLPGILVSDFRFTL